MQSALGWGYTYNQSGNVVSRTNGSDTYTFTYTETLKVETVSLNGLELHHFGYDVSGQRVSEQRSDGTLIYFVGEYYEHSIQGEEVHEKKYYGREAMREDGTLYFILADHLGSTSVVTDGSGNYLWEIRYDAWGAMRYTSGTSPTEKLYTGQRFSADLGLYDYKARWYDPLVGRFLMEDPIIPQQGVMRLERYAYVMNNPVFYIDPEGLDICDEDGNCYDRGKPSKKVRILDPVDYVGLKEEDIRILIVLVTMESSSGNVPDYVNYQKAWALLNLRSYLRSIGEYRSPALAFWRMHESKMLDDPNIDVKGSFEEQEAILLGKYEKYKNEGFPAISKDEFQALEAQVRKAVRSSYYNGRNSSADPVHGAIFFRDAGGYFYPNGKEGEPHLQDFNNPKSEYFDRNKYFDIVTNILKMERFQEIICQGQYCSPLYSFSTNPLTQRKVWTFTVFYGP